MAPCNPTTLTLQVIILVLILPIPILAATSCQQSPCRDSCGSLPIQYPFGTGPGCGYPPFHSWVFCSDDQQLTLLTRTGLQYPITSIDYSKQIVFIFHPNMSTSCSNISNITSGTGIQQSEYDALLSSLYNTPFRVHEDNHFALIGCSNISNSIYHVACNQSGDAKSICKGLDPCTRPADINGKHSNSTTCCVYSPWSPYELDFKKLGCSSYFAVYGHGRELEDDPSRWKFGVGLKYKFPPLNGTGYSCLECMKMDGECGFSFDDCYESYNCPICRKTDGDCGLSWDDCLKDDSSPSPVAYDNCNNAFKLLGGRNIGLYTLACMVYGLLLA